LPDTFTVADVLHVLRTNNGGAASATRDDDIVESLLGDLRAAERAASSNLRFSDLAARAEKT
jgi:hypothetical protein